MDAQGWLHTGDLGTMDSRDYLKITGRVKEMIIPRGESLFPAEIENAMLEHEQIVEIAAVGIPDDKSGNRLLASCARRTVIGWRPPSPRR
jgi:fatty-acyl-CoA synthase